MTESNKKNKPLLRDKMASLRAQVGQTSARQTFGPVQRPARSFFAPRAFTLPRNTALGKCSIVQEILRSPCDVRLIQSRYNEIIAESEYTVTIDGEQHSIHYSPMESIMTHLIQTRGADACVVGRIKVILYGQPESRRVQDQRIIPEATSFQINLTPSCRQARLLYVPLNAYWIDSPQLLRQAHQQGEEFSCHSDCVSGHAMAVIINQEEKTIDYYEPNGKFVAWYRPVANYLSEAFARHPDFQRYRIVDTSGCLPNYGAQTISGQPQCSYFSNLYAAIRLLCTDIDSVQVINEMIELGQQGILQLLQRFHCFLENYAQANGIFAAIEYLRRVYPEVVQKLYEFNRLDLTRVNQSREVYEKQLEEIEELAYNDVLTAARQLKKMNKELQFRSNVRFR